MQQKATRRVGHRGRQWALSVLVLLVVAGCSRPPSVEAVAPRAEAAAIADPAAASTGPAAEALAPAATTPSVPVALSEGMAYADLRKTVLAKGWKPKVDAQCKANVVGGNFDQVCKDRPDQCKVCDDVPELSSCSGDGHCLMNFERGAGEVLAVSTYGEIADWNVSGTSSRLSVKWWDPESIEAPAGK
jgi:hypothetical protein